MGAACPTRTGPHPPCLSHGVTAPQPLGDDPVVGVLGLRVPVAELATGLFVGPPAPVRLPAPCALGGTTVLRQAA